LYQFTIIAGDLVAACSDVIERFQSAGSKSLLNRKGECGMGIFGKPEKACGTAVGGRES
jgi:hypothetical protein